MFVAETKKLNIMSKKVKVLLELTFEEVKADPECGIMQDEYQLTDIYQGPKQLWLSPKLEELLNQEINPNN